MCSVVRDDPIHYEIQGHHLLFFLIFSMIKDLMNTLRLSDCRVLGIPLKTTSVASHVFLGASAPGYTCLLTLPPDNQHR